MDRLLNFGHAAEARTGRTYAKEGLCLVLRGPNFMAGPPEATHLFRSMLSQEPRKENICYEPLETLNQNTGAQNEFLCPP